MVWAGLWNKRVWADYEQLLRSVFSLFGGQKKSKFSFENTIASALKSCKIPFLQKFFLQNFDPEKVKKKTGFFKAKRACGKKCHKGKSGIF